MKTGQILLEHSSPERIPHLLRIYDGHGNLSPYTYVHYTIDDSGVVHLDNNDLYRVPGFGECSPQAKAQMCQTIRETILDNEALRDRGLTMKPWEHPDYGKQPSAEAVEKVQKELDILKSSDSV